MRFKDVNELIAKLELKFDTKNRILRKHRTGDELNYIADKYYYVNCKLMNTLTSEEELREAYYNVYLKLFSIYLKEEVKGNEGGVLLEIDGLCWIVFHKDNFKIDNCSDKEGILWVAKYNYERYLSKYFRDFGTEIYNHPSDYPDEVLKEAVQIVHNILGEDFVEQIYKDKELLERFKNDGYNKLVMYCLDYFPEGDMKDELYWECML